MAVVVDDVTVMTPVKWWRYVDLCVTEPLCNTI